MAQPKQNVIDILRGQWIDNHAEVRELEQELRTASEKAAHPEWNADPVLFCQAAVRALTQANDAKRRLIDKKAELSRQFREKLDEFRRTGDANEVDASDE